MGEVVWDVGGEDDEGDGEGFGLLLSPSSPPPPLREEEVDGGKMMEPEGMSMREVLVAQHSDAEGPPQQCWREPVLLSHVEEQGMRGMAVGLVSMRSMVMNKM